MRYRRDQGRLAQVCSPGTCYGPVWAMGWCVSRLTERSDSEYIVHVKFGQ